MFRVATAKMYTIERKTTDKNIVPPITLLPEFALRDKLCSSSEEFGSKDKNTRGLTCSIVVNTESLKNPESSLASNVALLTSQTRSKLLLTAGASKRAEFEKVVNIA